MLNQKENKYRINSELSEFRQSSHKFITDIGKLQKKQK